jgi:hypothetical protein
MLGHRTRCQAFGVNQFRFLLDAAAYILVDRIRPTAPVGSKLERAEVGTIRLHLLRIGALVTRTVRREVVRIASSLPGQELFGRVVQQLQRPRAVIDSS